MKKGLGFVIVAIIAVVAFLVLKKCGVTDMAKDTVKMTGELAGDVAGAAGDVAGAAGDMAKGAAGKVGDAVGDAAQGVADVADNAAQATADAAKGATEAVKSAADTATDAASGAVKGAAEAVGDAAKGALSGIKASLFKGATLLNDVTKKIVGDPSKKEEIFVSQAMGFGSGSAALSETGQALIKNLANYIKNHPFEKVMVEGHSDSSGNKDFNQSLSQKRAKSAMDYLVSQGIAVSKVEAKGFGDTKPVTSNETPEGRANNRRVVFKVMRK